MESERRRILTLLAEGKVTVTEAERLLDALKTDVSREETSGKKSAQSLRVTITPRDNSGKVVNVKIPLLIVKTGIKLGAFMPGKTQEQMQQAFRDRGISFNMNQLDGETVDRLAESLAQAAIEVDDEKGHIRIYCE